MGKITRRVFLGSAALAGGGALFGFFATPNRLSLHPGSQKESTWLATWISVNPDNSITVYVPHAEMGQGTHTALPMMLAEELEADWSKVKIQQAPAEAVFVVGDVIKGFLAEELEVPAVFKRHVDFAFYKIAGLMNMQITGGSASVRFTGQAGMRRAGAAAKEMLIRAAAENWQVDAAECKASLSYIHHSRSGRSASFSELASQATEYDVPPEPRLKEPQDYSICGKPVARFNSTARVTGKLDYGIDVALPGMRYAAIRHSPVFGGKAVSFDDSGIRGQRGIEGVLMLDDAVVLLADNYWRAKNALQGLPIEFSNGKHGEFDSQSLFREFEETLSTAEPEIDHEQGKLVQAREDLSASHQADYKAPFLAHATMEPMNCTAWFHEGELQIWTGTQDLLGARALAAEIAGLDMERVRIHPVQLGGGFGRRLPFTGNYIEDAVRVAIQVDYPVKLVYSREEDIQHDYYRPAVQSRFQAYLGAEGFPHTWQNIYTDIGINEDVHSARHVYEIEHQSIGRVVLESPVPVSYWRSVEYSYQGFFLESFIDELAAQAKQDPFLYRMKLMKNSPRYQAVLEKAAKSIGWGKSLPAGHGQGIAIVKSFGTIVAQAAEVSLSPKQELKIHKISAAVDPGEVINPQIARAQIEGGIIFGLSAALFGKITIEKGRVLQSNFPDYEMVKLATAPQIDVSFIESGEGIGGMGEVGVPPLAPAVCNAIYSASGRRFRELPLLDQGLRLSI